ncbi:MAG: MATE family efflux transporter [Bernardetiaceae bacterium]
MHTRRFTHHRDNLRLSIPIVLGQLSTVLMMTSDTLMVGNYSSLALAGAAFANNIFFLQVIPGFGLSSALKPLVANAHAAQRLDDCRQYLRSGLLLLLGYALGLVMLWPWFREGLSVFGQPSEVIVEARPFLDLLMFSMIPLLLFFGLTQFMESLSETQIPMYINLGGALLNVFLNYALIFGQFGFPALGLIGAGWASLLTRCLMLLVGLVILYRLRRFRPFVGTSWGWGERVYFRALLRLGIPISLQRLFEFTAFMTASLMAGWLGTVALAAYQIAFSLSAMTFMVAIGISEGTTIQTARQQGRKAYDQVRAAGNSGLSIVIVFMGVAALVLLWGKDLIPSWYVRPDDPNGLDIREMAPLLIVWVALYQIADGVQVVAMGALRGLEDVRIPTLIALLSYWIVGIPLGYVLSFVSDWGIHGIWMGLLTGLAIAALLLVWRFRRLSRMY